MSIPTFFRHEAGSHLFLVRFDNQPLRQLSEDGLTGYLRGYFQRDAKRIERARRQLARCGTFVDGLLTVEARMSVSSGGKRPSRPVRSAP